MATNRKPYLTPEQYIEIERQAETKSEYHDGEMFEMSGAREAHNLIVVNLAGELRARLRDRGCRTYVNDMRVQVDANRHYTYPDGIVVSGAPQFADGVHDTLLNPHAIIEVLSPSTEAYDRGRKFEQYRTVASLQQYLLLSSEKMFAESSTRQPGGGWLLTERTGSEQTLEVAGVELKLAELYYDVPFEQAKA